MKFQSDSLDYGCNHVFEIRHNLYKKNNPVFILSTGYGTETFDGILSQHFIKILERHEINWVQYKYPERDRRNITEDLLLSTGFHSLDIVFEWLKQKDFNQVCLFGSSFGGNISLELALSKPVKCVITVNPVLDYIDYRRRQLGKDLFDKWKTQGTIKLAYPKKTFTSSYRFIEEAEKQNILDRITSIDCAVLAFQGAKDEFNVIENIVKVAKVSENIKAVIVSTASHDFSNKESLQTFSSAVENFLSGMVLES